MRYIGVVGEGRGIGNDLLARACERCVISLLSTLEGFAEISYSNSRPISIVSASISSSFQCDREMRKHKPYAGHVQTIRFVNWRCQPRPQGLPSSHKSRSGCWRCYKIEVSRRPTDCKTAMLLSTAILESHARLKAFFSNLCSNE